jgi:C_GCAxxG_C_C family probable redox protein
LIEKAAGLGYQYEQQYGNCAQSVLAALDEVFGLVEDSLFQAAHGLAGGVGLTGQGTCGALSAAVLVISSSLGRERQEFKDRRSNRARGYAACQEISAFFERQYGGILCCEVQRHIMGRSFDLSDEKQLAAFKAAGGNLNKCPQVVAFAVRYAARLIVDGKI